MVKGSLVRFCRTLLRVESPGGFEEPPDQRGEHRQRNDNRPRHYHGQRRRPLIRKHREDSSGAQRPSARAEG